MICSPPSFLIGLGQREFRWLQTSIADLGYRPDTCGRHQRKGRPLNSGHASG